MQAQIKKTAALQTRKDPHEAERILEACGFNSDGSLIDQEKVRSLIESLDVTLDHEVAISHYRPSLVAQIKRQVLPKQPEL